MGEGFVGGSTKSQPLAYPTMTVEEIMALPIREVAAANAHLYLWTTNKFLPEAFEVIKAWGFRYSTSLVWNKAMIGGGLGGAYRINTEYCLFARRGKLAAKATVRGTVFDWKRPYDERGKPKHSAKPPEFIEQVELVSPGPYLELFSRATEPRPEWSYHGDQSLGTELLVPAGG